MPLFSSHRDSEPEPQPYVNNDPTPQPRKTGFFSSHRSVSPNNDAASRSTVATQASTNSSNGRTGFFRRSSPSDDYARDLQDDPSILGARQKVTDAETAESQADRALLQARMAVKEAREHVRILEREAIEDAKRAKAKQQEAKSVSRSARSLGRHGA